MTNQNQAKNTDIEIWRARQGDYYSPSIHVTQRGDIGINVSGHVIVAPTRRWHDAGEKILCVDPKISKWRYKLAYWLLGWKRGMVKK